MSSIKILVHGDLHGDIDASWKRNEANWRLALPGNPPSLMAVQNASKYGAQHIIQVGDCAATWPGRDSMVFLDRLNAYLVEQNIQFIWLDGNHEGFDELNRLEKFNPRNSDGQVYIRTNILYSPRGTIWKMDNKKFMTVGGAVSIDRQYRVAGKSWWPQEALTDQQVMGIINRANSRRAAGKPEVDYLFTHEAHQQTPFRGRFKNDGESWLSRDKISKVAWAVQPALWFHGHYHTRYDWTLEYSRPFEEAVDFNQSRVYGLADGYEKDSWGILDTDTDTFTFESEL